jgi:hypothetical protein
MKKKFARDFKRGRKKKSGHRLVITVDDDQYLLLKECAEANAQGDLDVMSSRLLVIALELVENYEPNKEYEIKFLPREEFN